MKSMIDEWFIKRGQEKSDPYLCCLGHMMKKEYIKSLNSFKIESGGGSNISNMMNPKSSYFSMGHLPEFLQEVKVKTIEDAFLEAH